MEPEIILLSKVCQTRMNGMPSLICRIGVQITYKCVHTHTHRTIKKGDWGRGEEKRKTLEVSKVSS